MSVFRKILRAGEGKKLRALASLVPEVGALEAETESLSDDALRGRTDEFRQRLSNGEDLDDLLIEAFAVVREAARRVIGQRHYDVQLMGGAALHFGWVAEMKTGEGKTLVSTLPVYLNGLSERGVHLITVNDYLASRDAEWMGQIHRWLGLTVGLVVPGNNDPEHKRRQYACDVTYGTNNEFGFDYLRDNMALSRDRQVQRGHAYAIVDEVDSILVDEARTPLIISGRVADAAKLYYKFASIVRGLKSERDYEVDEEKRTVAPTDEGIESVEQALGVENMYDMVSANLVHQLQAALKAKELYRRDRDYVVQDGEVKIVDEFTGRILEGRRWSEGLHQAVEAKEGVKIKEENQTLATITLQNYFRLYEKLAGMTGTATTEASEFAGTYGLQVVPIPTNEPAIRMDQPDLVYKSENAKFGAVVDDLVERFETGQPVLVGTISVEKSEKLGRLLEKRGVPHEVLNAKQHFREAEIVTQAGRLHAVTVATNMAGRGVDIILGGNPEGLARREVQAEGLDPDSEEGRQRYAELLTARGAQCAAEGDKVRELGGLYVLGTERHESRRIDNQLRGRSGRQGDPGESRFYLSLEDDLMRLFATGAMSWVMDRALPEDVPIESKAVSKAVERAQNTVEQKNAEIRKNVLKYDEVMNEQRKVIYRRRSQILDERDLRDEAMEALAEAVDGLVSTYCVSNFADEWDVDGLVAEVNALWPNEIVRGDLERTESTDEVYDRLMSQATGYYEQREEAIGPEIMRKLERQIMLRILDQKWREHLYEMDYLREGIGLRAMGQKDPLVEYQREGFEMFGEMMASAAQDFVRYLMHAEVVVAEKPEDQTALSNVEYSAPVDPSEAREFAGVPSGADAAGTGEGVAQEPAANVPVTRSESGARRAKRFLPLWLWEEVQALPWGVMADSPRDPEELGRRIEEAHAYLRIEELRGRRPQLETEAARPDLWDNPDLARRVTKELNSVVADLDLFDGLRRELEDLETLVELAREEGDESLEGEIEQAAESLEARLGELELRSLFSGEHDELDAVCEIHSGEGGTDAQDWAEMLLRMFLRWADRRGFQVELDEASAGQEAGITTATFIVHGRYAYGMLRGERGTHRLVRMSPFNAQGKRQTAFAALSVVPFLEEADQEVQIDETDLRIDTYRSSGAGGQHVNVTDSAVRITHLPTGTVVACQNERSQHQNKEKAMQILAAKLADLERRRREEELEELSGPKQRVGFGTQIRSYVLHPYQQVKDLRTGQEVGNVDAVLDGDLDGLIEAYLRWERGQGGGAD